MASFRKAASWAGMTGMEASVEFNLPVLIRKKATRTYPHVRREVFSQGRNLAEAERNLEEARPAFY